MVFFVFFYHYPFSRLFILLSIGIFSFILLGTRLMMIVVAYYGKKVGRIIKKWVIIVFFFCVVK